MRAGNIIAGCISYILSKNPTFQNISNTEELRKKGSDAEKRKQKCVI